MKQYFIFLILIIFLYSCSDSYINVPHMIAYCPYINVRVWIEENEIDLTPLKTVEAQPPLIFISFDEITCQLWAFLYPGDNKYIYFYNINKGIVDVNEKIYIERAEKFGLCKRIYNNKVLYTVDNKNYEIIDLGTKNKEYFVISDIDGKLPIGHSHNPLGFSNDKVIFLNGYYDILEQNYYFFNDLKYPRFIAKEEKVIGLNNDNYIIIYDLKNNRYENTAIKRKMSNYSKYSGDDLYFLENNRLFFSEDIHGLDKIIGMFLPIWYSRRKWYAYDLQEQKLSKFSTPGDTVILMGIYDDTR